jgi:hypothetical protein
MDIVERQAARQAGRIAADKARRDIKGTARCRDGRNRGTRRRAASANPVADRSSALEAGIGLAKSQIRNASI